MEFIELFHIKHDCFSAGVNSGKHMTFFVFMKIQDAWGKQ